MATEQLTLEVAVDGFAQFARIMGSMQDTLERMEQSLDLVAAAAIDTSLALGKYEKKTEDSEKKSESFAKTVRDTLSVALGNILARATEVAIEGLVNLGSAGVEAFKDSVDAAATFESAMADLGVAAKSSGASLEELEKAAINVGGATNLVGIDAQQAADSMTELYKAGLTTDQIFGDLNKVMEDGSQVGGALRAAVDLAAASELDLAQATEAVTISMATFGSEMETEAEQAQFVNDAMANLVQTADASNASVSELTAGLKNVAPNAVAAGISIEDVNAALAILNDAGIKGEAAGTALNQMLTSLVSPSKEGAEALADLGVSIFDAHGNMREFPDILRDFTSALFGAKEVTVEVGGRTAEQNKQLSEAQKRYDKLTQRIADHNAGLKTMSESSLKKANSELAANGALIAELSGVTGDLVKTTRTLTDEQRAAALGDIFTQAGRRSIITLTETLNDVNEEGADGWKQMTDAVAGAATMQDIMSAKTQTFSGQMEALDGVIDTLKIRIGSKFLPILTRMVKEFSAFVERVAPKVEAVIVEIASVIDALIRSFLELTLGGSSWRDFIQNDLEPMILTLLESFKNLGAAFFEIAQAVIPFLVEQFQKVSRWFEENRETITKVLSNFANAWTQIAQVLANDVWPIMKPIFDALVNIILDIGSLVLALAEGDWPKAWSLIGKIFIDAVEGIVKSLAKFTEKMLNIWGSNAEQLVQIIELFVQKVIDFFVELYDELIGNSIITDMLDAIILAFEDFIMWALQLWEDFKTSIINIVNRMKDAVIQAIQTMLDAIAQKVSDFKATWLAKWEEIKEALVTAFNAMVETAREKMQEILTAIIETLEKIGEWIRSNATKIKAWGEQIIIPIIEGIRNKIKDVKTAIQDLINAIGSKIGGAAGDLISWGKDIAGNIANGIEQGINTIADAIQSIFDQIASNAGGVATGLIESLKKLGWNMVTSIAAGLLDNINKLADTLRDMIEQIIQDILPGGGGGDDPDPPPPGGPEPSFAGPRRTGALSNPLSGFGAMVSPIASAAASNVSNMSNSTTNNNFNLTTQTMASPDEVRFVFEDMALSMATR